MVTAYALAKQGWSVDLHEAGPRLGGMISSERTPHGLVESAANGFVYTEELASLFSELKLDHIQPLPEFKKKRFIFRRGLQRWPLGFLETASFLMKAGFLHLFQRNKFPPKAGETVWDWGLRTLGFPASKYLLSPGLQGIYAGTARSMSASLILGPLFRGGKTKSRYRGTVSFKNGMQEFLDRLTSKLNEMRVRIHLNSRYLVSSAEVPHVICVSAMAVPEVVQTVAPSVSEEFAKVEMLPVVSVTVFYETARQKMEGFGCLFPEDQGFKALGVLSNTYIFENRGPDYSETWIFGGTRSPEILNKGDIEILSLIQDERKKIFPSYAEFSEFRLHRWPKGLPHYTVGLEKILDRVQLPKNLYLHGNYLGGIGLSKILTRTHELVATIEAKSEGRGNL
jgi:oxygen-dependent protoporphyrinogen oxidase